MSRGAIKPHAPLECSEDTRLLARANCAARCREKGEEELALAFEAGTQDEGWRMRFEAMRIEREGVSA